MGRIRKFLFVALAASAALWFASLASAAGPILTWLGFGDDPPPSYCPARYLAPGASRLYDDLHGPKISVIAPDRHPEVPPTFETKMFPTSVAIPGATIILPPTPPATSKAQ